MTKHVFRNPDLYQELPWRKWSRGEYEKMPFPQIDGVSVEDIDLVVTLFGGIVNRHRSSDGKFKIIEVKQGHAEMEYGQRRMYALMDKVLKKGDPDGQWYKGFYRMQWTPPECRVNNIRLSMDQLVDFYLDKLEIAPLTSDEIMSFGDLV